MNKQSRHGGAWILLYILVLCPVGWADSVVVVNEIMYHPADGSSEWIELYNQMGIDIDLSGWSLEGAVDYTFAEGTVIQSGDYLVVASDPASVQVLLRVDADTTYHKGGDLHFGPDGYLYPAHRFSGHSAGSSPMTAKPSAWSTTALGC